MELEGFRPPSLIRVLCLYKSGLYKSMCLHEGFYVHASVLSAIVGPIPGDLYAENRVIATFRCTSWTCTWRLMAFVAGGAD